MYYAARSTYMLLVLSIEQPRNAENALLSFGYLSAGPSRQKAEWYFDVCRKNIVKLISATTVEIKRDSSRYGFAIGGPNHWK